MQEVVSLADYVGNSADVILRHYLGRSKRRKIVIVSESSKKTEVANSEEGKPQAHAAQIKQVVELEHQNVRLQTILQSLVRFIQAILAQFVPEAQRAQLLAFVTTVVDHDLPSSNSNTLEPVKSLDEELAECAAWLSFQDDTE
jgi:pyruvate-formate lyase-activating enzyme